MAAPRFVDRLSEQEIPLNDIMLDPNNPRLIGLDGYNGVREDRVAESGVQLATINRLNGYRAFDQESLRASIEESGLMPIDRIVVRPLPKKPEQPQLYVVVEGNRRIAACKTLMQQHERGEKTLEDDVRSTIDSPRVLVMAEADAAEARIDQWVIQGVRHISGIRPWGAFQVAKTIEAMLDKLGYSEQDVASALGIGVQRIRRSQRVLAALGQMGESEDYSLSAGPESFGYFDEVLKRPAVRNWLRWSDNSKTFEEEDRITQFYSWITPDEDLDGRKRIPVAEGVRKLDSILEDSAALAVLNTPGSTVDDALRVAVPQPGPDWVDPIKRAIKALDIVPIGDLENLGIEDRDLINDLITLATKRLTQADTFKK